MRKVSFNENWKYSHLNEGDWKNVTLPHDAMLSEPRHDGVPNGRNTGFFVGRDYCYEKEIFLTDELTENILYLEFEGVYHNAEVYLNGELLIKELYGYNDFYVDITDKLLKGQNILQVNVYNSDQPNSRWYTGAGIYRPVWIWYGKKGSAIHPDNVRIRTLSYESPVVEVNVKTAVPVFITVMDGNTVIARAEAMPVNCTASCKIPVSNAQLWNTEHPKLYTCVVSNGEDDTEISFGVRTVEWTPEKGFCINGERVILNGCCIHHDNGLLGAAEYDFAAERKIKLLKSVGYNAIRSAHNPCSKAILNACDKLGMLVLDEYADMWYIHKNEFDYASYVSERYKEDIAKLVAKDYNHPSVVMYSTGNEVSETAHKKGVDFNRVLTKTFHEEDDTRPVTCGVNLFFNFLAKLGVGMTSQSTKKKPKKQEHTVKKTAGGSEFFNNLASAWGSDTMKVFAKLPFCDWATSPAFSTMDIAGYNYGISRYKKDLKKYPKRLILGSETFITDVWQFDKIKNISPRIVGDFVWTGMDYIGEVALGSLDYSDYVSDFNKSSGWLTAGCGCLDITGQSQGHTAYTRVVFEKEPIAIAVHPVNHTGEGHMTSAWRKIHAFESWSWNGCEGKKAVVEVYTKAFRVGLFLNGKKIAVQKTCKNYRNKFKLKYIGGELKAVGYDKGGNIVCEKTLKTAGEETMLRVEAENAVVPSGGLIYVRFRYTDRFGMLKPLSRAEISVKVEDGELLGFGNACPYNEKGYLSDKTDTYFGEALAIIRPTSQVVKVTGNSKFGTAVAIIKIS